MYELRRVNRESVESIYRNIVDVYDADVFILCQRQFEDDAERVARFARNVVKSGLYAAREDEVVREVAKRWSDIRRKSISNFLDDGNLNVYINNAMFSGFLGEDSKKYDWFVMTRTDSEILFPFPPRELLADLEPGVYGFSPAYCKEWGGSGGGNIVHRDFIHQYLTVYRDCLDGLLTEAGGGLLADLSNLDINQERFLKIALAVKKIELREISTINYFYTAESEDARSTWSKIVRHPEHGVLCKYLQQCTEAHENKRKWDEGARWAIVDSALCIV